MKTQIVKTLTVLAVLAAAVMSAKAQYTYTTLDIPGVGSLGTYACGISGTNIVGFYQVLLGWGIIFDRGFLYNGGDNWTTFYDDPGYALSTSAQGISGTNIVGTFHTGLAVNPGDIDVGFLYNSSIWTTLNDPLAGNNGDFGGTSAQGIDGTNIVGYYYDTNNAVHGFICNGSTWTTLDDPLAGSGSSQGTYAEGISGTTIVGYYTDSNSYPHGFLYDGVNWATLDYPGAGGNYPTVAQGISGSSIVGYYYETYVRVHGFLYNGSTWTTLDDPLGVGKTYAQGISGANIVGYYSDTNGVDHGFLATPTLPQLTITPSANTLKISWPSWASNYFLQQNFDLAPTNWVNVNLPEPPTMNISNMQYEVVLNPLFVLQNSHYNFRLKQQ